MKGKQTSFIFIILLIVCTVCISIVFYHQGQRYQVFVEPTDGYAPVLDALNSAESSIYVEMYLITDKNIINALKNASLRGVNVRVLLEDWSYGSPASFKAIMDSLNSSGISVLVSNPTYRLTHMKAIVIDRKVALIMTLNQATAAYTKNREFGIIDYNIADAAEIASAFEADWNRTTPELSDPDLVWSPVNSRGRIFKLIDGAEKSLEIENEEMQDDGIVSHLLSAAKRGVDVKVVMSPSSSKKDPNEPRRKALIEGGVNVRLIKSPYIHAKVIIADGVKGFIGSENFSPTSLDKNRELGILIDDPKVLDILSSTFDEDWHSGAPTQDAADRGFMNGARNIFGGIPRLYPSAKA